LDRFIAFFSFGVMAAFFFSSFLFLSSLGMVCAPKISGVVLQLNARVYTVRYLWRNFSPEAGLYVFTTYTGQEPRVFKATRDKMPYFAPC
jgi:hypothetical protein